MTSISTFNLHLSSPFSADSESSYNPDSDHEQNDHIHAVEDDTIITKKRKRPQKRTSWSASNKNSFEDDGIDLTYDHRISQYREDQARRLANKTSKKEKEDNDADYSEGEEENEQDQFYSLENDPDVEIGRGLFVPAYIYHNLFSFQRESLEWLWKLHQQGAGGILGDEMGLGKTVQLIAFLASLSHSQLLETVLIICPASVLLHWVRELHKWYPLFRCILFHSCGSAAPSSRVLENLFTKGGVLITTYEGMRMNNESILEIEWDYVILDEGHRIRNPDAEITLLCKQLRTVHRIILTGAPIQNRLRELWSLFDFVFPGRLGTLPTFEDEFVLPIRQGGYVNASKWQIFMAYKCAIILRDLISPYLLRRLKKDVQEITNLPDKLEQVIFCKLAKKQLIRYKCFLNSDEVQQVLNKNIRPFRALTILRKICNHVHLLDYPSNDQAIHHWNKDDEEDDEVDDMISSSGKMEAVHKILPLWKQQKHRVLLFTQTRSMLTILENYIIKQGWQYCRLDGTTPVRRRQYLIDEFTSNESIFIFLLTTRAGGIGINLMGANRVLIYDPDWNPSTDIQARERAWRLGQTKSVTIYRLITCGTIEEKIYHRQIFKQYLTNKILKDPKQRRCFKKGDLFDLFTLQEINPSIQSHGTETADLFLDGHVERKEQLEKKKEIKNEEEEKDHKHNQQLQESLLSVATVQTSKQLASSFSIISSKPQNQNQNDEDDDDDKKQQEDDDEEDKNRKKSINNSNKEDSNDNDRILNHLFDTSGIQSVFSHDVLEADGIQNQEIDLIEMEANKMAIRAVDSIAQSQKNIRKERQGSIHVPTWTGKHGKAGKPQRLFGKRLSSSSSSSYQFSSTHQQVALRSEEMLNKIKNRQHQQRQQHQSFHRPSSSSSSSSLSSLFQSSKSHKTFLSMEELTNELNQFLSNHQQYGSTTQQILHHFNQLVRKQDKINFRALLRQMAELKDGKWRIKEK